MRKAIALLTGIAFLASCSASTPNAAARAPEAANEAAIPIESAAAPDAPVAAATPASAGGWPDAGWPKGVKPAALSAAQTAAIMATAGYKRIRGKWIGCQGQSEGHLYDNAIADLNGDGHVDVIVSGTNVDGQYCYNSPETGSTIVAATPTGWKVVYEGGGSPNFLKTRGKNGWPDIFEDIGSTGAQRCATPRMRFNGNTYDCPGGR